MEFTSHLSHLAHPGGKNLAQWVRGLITVRDIFYILVGFILAGGLAIYTFNFYMSSAVKVGGLVFQQKAYTVQARPAADISTVETGEN